MIDPNPTNAPPTQTPLPPERSKDINLIAGSLAKAQGQLDKAQLNSKNSFLGSSYADLTSVVDAIRKPLASNGLAISQTFLPQGNQTLLSTILLHESGQFLRGFLPLLNVNDWHSLGSAISYARRYSINSMLAVASADGTDDDGETAMGRKPRAPRKAPVKKPNAKAALDAVRQVIAEVPGGDEYLRGKGVDPGDPPANVREKILELGAEGMKKKIAEQRKKEEADEIVDDAEKVKPVDETEVAA